MRGFAARFLAMMQSAPASLDRDRGFRAVMVGSSALGAGCLIASLPMVQSGPSGIDFRWNYWAIPAFALGAVMAVGFWQLIFRLAVQRGDEAASRRKLYAASAGLMLVAFGAFIYPLRFVVPERRTDVLIGLGMAIIALSAVGMLIRTVVKWLESDADEHPEDRR
jgi:hypothetical protein